MELPLRGRARNGQRYNEDQLEQIKEVITRHYVNGNMKRKDVMIELERLGLPMTENQFKKKLTLWRIDTHNVKKRHMEKIVRISAIRKIIQGKESAFRVQGKEVPQHKIDRHMKERRLSQQRLAESNSPVPNSPSISVRTATPGITDAMDGVGFPSPSGEYLIGSAPLNNIYSGLPLIQFADRDMSQFSFDFFEPINDDGTAITGTYSVHNSYSMPPPPSSHPARTSTVMFQGMLGYNEENGLPYNNNASTLFSISSGTHNYGLMQLGDFPAVWSQTVQTPSFTPAFTIVRPNLLDFMARNWDRNYGGSSYEDIFDLDLLDRLESYRRVDDPPAPPGGYKTKRKEEIYWTEQIAMLESKHGSNHPKVLNAVMKLAGVYRNQLRYHSAEIAYRHVAKSRQMSLGSSSRETLEAFHSLALMLGIQGRYITAEKILRRIIQVQSDASYVEEDSLINTYHDLARSFHGLGQFEDSGELMMSVLKYKQTKYGPEHTQTLIATRDLINSQSQNSIYRYEHLDVARELYKKLEDKSSNSIAHVVALRLSQSLTYFGGEEESQRIIIEIERKISLEHDKLHSVPLDILHEIAASRYDQGNLGESERLFRELLTQSTTTYGKLHQKCLVIVGWIVDIMMEQSRFKEAEILLLEFLASIEEASEPDNYRIINLWDHFASLKFKQALFHEAEEIYRKVWTKRKVMLGEINVDTIQSRARMANAIANQGRYVQAERILRQTAETCVKAFGYEHEVSLETRRYLAYVMQDLDRWEEAKRILVDGLGISKRVLGINHIETRYYISGLKGHERAFRSYCQRLEHHNAYQRRTGGHIIDENTAEDDDDTDQDIDEDDPDKDDLYDA